ncbi:hypothetical protein [Pseudonocardia sp. NPDC049635]|uniref:hypothetical protein n=1 Tax=Pseudonocardia sp. NPDC049635 TaxID=3155506 RepID=UPI0033CAF4EF
MIENPVDFYLLRPAKRMGGRQLDARTVPAPAGTICFEFATHEEAMRYVEFVRGHEMPVHPLLDDEDGRIVLLT